MNEHSLKVLEYPKIIALIRGKCLTPFGAEEVDKICPMGRVEDIRTRQAEVSQLRDIVKFGLPFPLYRLEDTRELISQSKVVEHFLEPKEMLLIVHLVSVSIELNHYDKEGREKFPLVAEHLTRIRAFPELKTEITRAIDDDGNVKDSASKALRSIRSELAESRRRIVSRLEQILSKQSKQSGWQDDVVTMRNDRYVIGIPTSQYHADLGILHDRSQTGATFFVEPQETVELNNRIHMLYQEERQEIVRILRALSAEIGNRAEALQENCRLIGHLDCLHACANFSVQIGGSSPVIRDNATFALKDVRHPLLLIKAEDKKTVIPNSLELDDSRSGVLITGPNTGGKTILLKTVGLSVLMAQSGLHIAADEHSEVGVFREIYADIGDEQSIEMSLSTFSSHIANIIAGLRDAKDDVLLLFDEIGAGTDPREGAALAEAIIVSIITRGARLIASTHYSQLKTLAMDYPQLENASLDFNRKTLAPTYQLKLGIPGSSYAVEIAGRLGLPEDICGSASSLLSGGEKSLDRLIQSLEEELKDVKQEKTELSDRLEKTKALEEEYRAKNEYLRTEAKSEKERLVAETQGFLEKTRKEIERLVAEIRTSGASPESVKEFHRTLRAAESSVARRRDGMKRKAVDQTTYEVGDRVEIISLNQRGEVDALIGKDKARVKVGNVFTTVDLRSLRKTEQDVGRSKSQDVKVSYDSERTVDREIHLRGMTAEEAREELDRFLDRAVVAGIKQVYVIHGKGSGVLRKKLTEYLRGHPEVESIRLGNWNEGGAGVTIVKLKD